jgi:hypothetical protein
MHSLMFDPFRFGSLERGDEHTLSDTSVRHSNESVLFIPLFTLYGAYASANGALATDHDGLIKPIRDIHSPRALAVRTHKPIFIIYQWHIIPPRSQCCSRFDTADCTFRRGLTQGGWSHVHIGNEVLPRRFRCSDAARRCAPGRLAIG